MECSNPGRGSINGGRNGLTSSCSNVGIYSGQPLCLRPAESRLLICGGFYHNSRSRQFRSVCLKKSRLITSRRYPLVGGAHNNKFSTSARRLLNKMYRICCIDTQL